MAADWYRNNGFDVIARNWTVRGGELDVVARRGKLIVVCEVKARATLAFGDPSESVTEEKQRRVRRTGFAFVRDLGESGLRIRFDVARVLGTELEILEDAF